jgi:ribonuclease HI
MRFKKNKVWVALTPDGKMMEKKGKVLLKYQLNQEYEYWVHPSSIQPIDSKEDIRNVKTTPVKPKSKSRKSKPATNKYEDNISPDEPDAIRIYTDGASSGNPGPSGIGVLMCFGDHEKEISRHIGMATNNIAEIEAIRAGLSALKVTHLPVRIYTDSSYALGVLTKAWRAKKNEDLIQKTKTLMTGFKDLKFYKVKGHAGIEGNERANQLATGAISSAASGKR